MITALIQTPDSKLNSRLASVQLSRVIFEDMTSKARYLRFMQKSVLTIKGHAQLGLV